LQSTTSRNLPRVILGGGAALLALASACSGLLNLDDFQYATGDASAAHDSATAMDAPVTDAPLTETLVSDAPVSDASVSDATCPAPADAACQDHYYATVMGDHPVAYFRLSETTLPANMSFKNEVPCSAYTCTYALGAALSPNVAGINACAPAVHLDSAASAILLRDPAGALDFPGDTAFTLEAWIAVDPVDGALPLALLGTALTATASNGPGNGYHVSIVDFSPGYMGPRDEMWVDGSLSLLSQYSGLPSPSHYFSLVLTHDPTDHLDHLYVDGVNSGENNLLYSTGARPATGLPFAWTGFVGSLGEIAIYDHALSQAQVAAHFAAGGI
jgi:hypothetical protein